jgi:hypothetical protein
MNLSTLDAIRRETQEPAEWDWPPRLGYDQQLQAVVEMAQPLARFTGTPDINGRFRVPPTLAAFQRPFRQTAYRRWAAAHPVRALPKAP